MCTNCVKNGLGGRLRGNTIRGNRPERFWEGNLPLRGSLKGALRGLSPSPQKESGKRSLAKKWRKKWQKHQKKWPKSDRKRPENEKKWSNSFCRTPFAPPCHFALELRVMLPLIMLPLNTPTICSSKECLSLPVVWQLSISKEDIPAADRHDLCRGPCETDWCLAAKIALDCLEAIFDSQLPSPKLSPKMPPKLSLPHKRGLFILFQN